MEQLNKILLGLVFISLGTSLTSCSIAIKAIYNQFSDEEEFVLFQGKQESMVEDVTLETSNHQTDSVNHRLNNERKDLADEEDLCMELNFRAESHKKKNKKK